MRGIFWAVLALLLCVASPEAARADVKVEVDVASQTMDVYVNGRLRHSWRVSTGARGYETPTGNFRVRRMEREWYSTLYDDAPMPHSIFFNGGIAIHGTNHTRRLGRAASHGCIRLAPGHAARLFALVEDHGPRRTRISVYD